MTNKYKLYRDGRFFDLTDDAFETRSIPAEQLEPQKKMVAAKLQEVINSYADARPQELRGPAPTPLNKSNARQPAKLNSGQPKAKAKARKQAQASQR